MAKVIVYVKGGIVQDVISDVNGIDVMVVDYDIEQDRGISEREFESVRTDPSRFGQTINSVEQPY